MLRMYGARIGRWLSVDPERQYASGYKANGNNPLNQGDPTGGYSPDPDWYRNTETQEVVFFENISHDAVFVDDTKFERLGRYRYTFESTRGMVPYGFGNYYSDYLLPGGQGESFRDMLPYSEASYRRGGYLIVTNGLGRTPSFEEFADDPPEFIEVLNFDDMSLGLPGHKSTDWGKYIYGSAKHFAKAVTRAFSLGKVKRIVNIPTGRWVQEHYRFPQGNGIDSLYCIHGYFPNLDTLKYRVESNPNAE